MEEILLQFRQKPLTIYLRLVMVKFRYLLQSVSNKLIMKASMVKVM